MNKLIYIILIISVIIGCDKDELLDIKPYGKEIPETVEDFRLMMDNMGTATGIDKGRVPCYDVDLVMTDEIKVPDGFGNNFINYFGDTRFYDALHWSKDFGGAEETDYDWEILYNQIYVSNLIMDYLKKTEITGDDDLRQQLIAEAKIHRAIAHFSLVNLYSKQYDPTTASRDLGIPIKLTSETGETAKNPRGTVQEVYDVILRDLKEAINSGALEVSVPKYNWRASKVAAYATLARVYLQMGNYTDALKVADECLNIYNVLTDLNNVSSAPLGQDNKEIILLKSRPGRIFTSVFVNDELEMLFASDDLRPDIRFRVDYTYGTGEYVYDNFTYVGSNVGEIYLIRAECNARADNIELAISDLNTLRSTRYIRDTYIPLTIDEIPDGDSALAFVKAERRRELAGNGLRLFDLKRYNALDDANISLTHVVDGEVIVLEANSNRWIVPIARKIFNLAPEIEQSPR